MSFPARSFAAGSVREASTRRRTEYASWPESQGSSGRLPRGEVQEGRARPPRAGPGRRGSARGAAATRARGRRRSRRARPSCPRPPRDRARSFWYEASFFAAGMLRPADEAHVALDRRAEVLPVLRRRGEAQELRRPPRSRATGRARRRRRTAPRGPGSRSPRRPRASSLVPPIRGRTFRIAIFPAGEALFSRSTEAVGSPLGVRVPEDRRRDRLPQADDVVARRWPSPASRRGAGGRRPRRGGPGPRARPRGWRGRGPRPGGRRARSRLARPSRPAPR